MLVLATGTSVEVTSSLAALVGDFSEAKACDSSAAASALGLGSDIFGIVS